MANSFGWLTPEQKRSAKTLNKREIKDLGDGLGDLLAHTIGPARMPARDIGDRVGSAIAAQLMEYGGHQFSDRDNKPAIEFSLRTL